MYVQWTYAFAPLMVFDAGFALALADAAVLGATFEALFLAGFFSSASASSSDSSSFPFAAGFLAAPLGLLCTRC